MVLGIIQVLVSRYIMRIIILYVTLIMSVCKKVVYDIIVVSSPMLLEQ